MTAYVYSSGGFPASPVTNDTLVINNAIYDWTGTIWQSRSTNATATRVDFIATAGQATKTGLTYTVGNIDCFLNGSKMTLGTDFTATDGVSVTFTPALTLNDEVQLIMDASASAAGVGVVTGTTLPSPVSAVGSLFFKTDDTDLYVSNGTDWERVASAVPNVMSATGGTITTTATHKIHTFSTSGVFQVTGAGEFEYLVIAGGGGGSAGGSRGGGAGAGGYRTNVVGEISGGGSAPETTLTLGVAAYTITVGAGGAGASTDDADGVQGSDSSIGSANIVSVGGGKAAIGGGVSGGSGSGASGSVYSLVGGSGTTGQGSAGGNATAVHPYAGGGGGGAGSVGVSYSGSQSGAGGAGQSSSITGTSIIRAGGGGGAATSQGAVRGLGGIGGGGKGAAIGVLAISGAANTGSGGGSSENTNPPSLPAGSGGSGIVIIRYTI
jgi:hypothetical protein